MVPVRCRALLTTLYAAAARYKTECLLFCVGFCVALCFYLAALVLGTNPHLPIIVGGEDVEEYFILANNLLQGKGFTLSATEPYVPESFRAPAYPVVIAPLLALFGTPVVVPVLHALLFAGIVLLTFLLARKWFGTLTAIVAAGLSIVNASLLYHVTILASETLFIFLFLLALWLWVRAHAYPVPRKTYAVVAGVLLGLATLTRVIGFLLPVAFLLLSGVMYLSAAASARQRITQVLVLWLALTVSFSAVLAPWLARNVLVYDAFALSSTGTINMWYFNIPQAIADMRGISVEQARNEYMPPNLLRGMVGPNKYDFPLRQLDATPTLKNEVDRYLDAHLGEYIQGHLLRAASIPFVDTFRDSAILFGVNVAGHNILPAEMTPLVREGDALGLILLAWSYLTEGDWENVLALTSFVVWVTLVGGMVLGIVFAITRLPREKKMVAVLCCVGMIVYFAILSGAMAVPRMRLPMEPFMVMLGGYGVIVCLGMLFRHFKNIFNVRNSAEVPTKTI